MMHLLFTIFHKLFRLFAVRFAIPRPPFPIGREKCCFTCSVSVGPNKAVRRRFDII